MSLARHTKIMAETGKRWSPAMFPATDEKYYRNQCTRHIRSRTHRVGGGTEKDVVDKRVPEVEE